MGRLLQILMVLTTLLLVACSNDEDVKEEKSDSEIKSQEIQVGKESKELLNEELTEKIKKDKEIVTGKVYEINETAIASIEIGDNVTEEKAKQIADKYVNELTKEYGNKNIQIKVKKNGKEVTSITKNTEPVSNNNTSITVESLIKGNILTLKPNPISQQLSVILDSKKFEGELKGKKAEQLKLVVEEEVFVFKANKFENTIFNINNTDFTEKQLKSAKIQIENK